MFQKMIAPGVIALSAMLGIKVAPLFATMWPKWPLNCDLPVPKRVPNDFWRTLPELRRWQV